MPRYEHWLASGGRATFPGRVISLECCGRMEPAQRSGASEVERLTTWHMATMKGDTGCYGKAKSWAGSSCESFWSALLPWQSANGSTFVYGWRMTRLASLLGLFQRIEEGRLALAGMDERTDQRRANQFNQSCVGHAVLEDPPTVIVTRNVGSSGVTVWLDVRNYGIDRTSEPHEPEAWCHLILGWVRDISDQLKRHNLGGLKNTAGSLAFASWKHYGIGCSVLCHTHQSALQLERQAYYGGRCEAFRLGEHDGPIYHLDVKAMYPFCCQAYPLPVSLKGIYSSALAAHRILDADNDCVIADVDLQTDEPDYPVRRAGHTIWPIGSFRTTLCGPELYSAYQCHRITRLHRMAVYESGYPMREWMQAWYRIRSYAEQQSLPLLGASCKRIMCSLPGKLGQREIVWRNDPRVMADSPWCSWHSKDSDGNTVRYRALDWTVQREQVLGTHPESVPAISAYVTSLGRTMLRDLIAVAKREHVYYCDTDSLMVDREGIERLYTARLTRDGEWGYLQHKGIHDTMSVYGVKHYALDGEIVCSGCPCSPQSQGPTADSVWFYGRTATALREGHPPDASRVLRHWHRDTEYPLGCVDASGIVTPFTLEE